MDPGAEPGPRERGDRRGAGSAGDRHARRLRALIWGSLALLVVFVAMVALDLRGKSDEAAFAETTGDMLMHSQRLAKAVPIAIQGDPAAFAQLRESRDQLAAAIVALDQGGTVGNAACPPRATRSGRNWPWPRRTGRTRRPTPRSSSTTKRC